MIAEAIKKIVEMSKAENRIVVIGDEEYTDAKLVRVRKPHEQFPATLDLHTLTGIVDFLAKDLPDLTAEACRIHVVSHNDVRVIGELQPSNDNARFVYAVAKMGLPGYEFNRFMPLENFIISLQSQFVQTEEVNSIINYLGNLASETVKENKDDGFSQSIQVRVGIRTKSEVKIENPILLNPYRTFREIEQPTSSCVLRLRKDRDGELQCALFCADGDAWTLDAIEDIKRWFIVHVPGVTIIA